MRPSEFIRRSSDLETYRPGEPLAVLAGRLGVPKEDILKLNANENLFLPRTLIQGIVIDAARETDPRLYPEEEEQKLIGKLASLNGVPPESILVSAGGDQLIDLVLSSFLERGDTVLAVKPTFSMYPRMARIKGLNLKMVGLDSDFSLDPKRILSESRNADLIILCSPNNPTSNQLPREDVLEVVEGCGKLVLVDEAYSEFGRYTLVEEAAGRENLIVLRTFSKAYGLAGLRLGFAVTSAPLAATLAERYMMPYSVPSIVLSAGAKILDEQRIILETISEITRERSRLIEALNSVPGVRAFASDANFVLFNTGRPFEEVYAGLLERGIIVRKIGEVAGHRDCLRVTVAPREGAERFLSALEEVLE
jgi:histidinol-phosphate aminotransferase